jgi:glycosyltransferase involved in cell wall biosynthesis
MINDMRVVVVLPAYNASKTLRQTYSEIPFDIVDDVILVDDFSKDDTVLIAQQLGIEHIIIHNSNMGYGGNQKSCYTKALELGGDIVVMVHPDYQYTPKLIHSMVYIIANNIYPVVLASRILGRSALKGGMPLWRYYSNRILTLIQNIIMKQKLSEYHTGYRAFSGEVLRKINFLGNSDDFVFDNQMLAQILFSGFSIAEVTCPTRYHEEASSINFSRSVRYGFGVLGTSFAYRMQKWGICNFRIFQS